MHAHLLVLANGKSVKRLKVLEQRLSNVKRLTVAFILCLVILAAIFYQNHRERRAVREARRHQDVAYGNAAMESGNLLGALPYLADALAVDDRNSPWETTDRLRLGSVLAQCPKLSHFWFENIGVNCGEFSPDGTKVLITQDFGKAEIYDLKTDQLYLHPFGPEQGLMSASYSHDGRLVITASGNRSASVWDSITLEEIRHLQHPMPVFSARFSRDGRRIITACKDKFARVWNAQTGETELKLKHDDAVLFADFSQDGKFIVTCSRDHTARIWNATDGMPVCPPLQHQGWVYYAAFSPDGETVVTASGDHKARVWDVATGRKISPNLIHDDAVTSAEYSPDGRLILTASLDGTVHLWTATDFEPYAFVPVLQQGDRVTHAAFASESPRILATCADGTIRIWDLAGSLPSTLPRAIFDREGRRFLVIAHRSVEIRDALSGKTNATITTEGISVENASFSPNGSFVLTTSITQASPIGTNRLVQVWNAVTGQAIAPALMFTNFAAGVSVSDDGKRLIAFAGHEAQMWNIQNQLLLSPSLLHPDEVTAAFFSPDSIHAATVSTNLVRVWQAANGESTFAPLVHSQIVMHAEYSLDGSRLVSCCADPYYSGCYAQVWNAFTGQPVGSQLRHRDGVLFAAISPDGNRIATASEDFTAIIWDVITGRQLAVLRHKEKVQRTAFSRDGKWLVTASTDKTARVWSVETGDPLTPPLRHACPLTDAQFLVEGQRIVVSDLHGNHHIWVIPIEQRPADDVRKLARLLSGDKVVFSGSLPPPASESIKAIWQQLRNKYPSGFNTSTLEIAAWDDFEAEDSEQAQQWFAAAFHLRRLLLVRPGDQDVATRLYRANDHLKKDD